jgi:hypothetical protein
VIQNTYGKKGNIKEELDLTVVNKYGKNGENNQKSPLY